MSIIFVVLLLSLNLCVSQDLKEDLGHQIEDPYKKKECTQITQTFCKGIEYNYTMFPNVFGHTTQDDAGYYVAQFYPLVKVKCSRTLRLFLCSLYFPVCNKLNKLLKPCKSLCMENRRGCEPLMKRFNFQWPANMDCDSFPEHNMCIRQNNSQKETGPDSTVTPKKFSFTCPPWLKVPPSYDYSVVMDDHIEEDCGLPCDQFFFSHQSANRYFARLWIFLWACLCAASTLFTVLTFLVDMQRFRYPERPIIFLSACYFIVALVYIVGFALGNSVACSGPFPSQTPGVFTDKPLIITQGTKREGCTILFMLLYFFTMASSIWWVVLCLTWYLAAGQHWVHEAIAQHSQYFHFVAWSIPAAKTIGILAWGKVDGDPLSGVCFTGLNNNTALVGFLIVPMCIYLMLGTAFLIAGFVSLFKIRTIIKRSGGGTKTDKLEKLIMRIGVFSVLYLVPAVVVVGCYFYEYKKKAIWMRTWHNQVCRSRATLSDIGGNTNGNRLTSDQMLALTRSYGEIGCPELNYDPKNNESPIFELFMIKYLMIFIVGITSGFWIWSGKTLLSWCNFFSNLCNRHREPIQNAANGMGMARDQRQPLRGAQAQGRMFEGNMVGQGGIPPTGPAGLGYHHVPGGDKMSGSAPMPLQWAGPNTTNPGMLKTNIAGGMQGLSMV